VGRRAGQGRDLLLGGERRIGDGNWFDATVLTNVDHTMEVMREESFGPVIGIQKVAATRKRCADERHALRPDRRRLHARRGAGARILSQVHAGSVYWNCCDRVSPRCRGAASAIPAWG
jgi:acyl-CoA reductase-like NAD-dependent aldehyde dehydrogenase